MTWFQSLNPLLVFAFTPWLVSRWTKRAEQGRDSSPIEKMSFGAAGVAGAYLMIAAVAYVCEAQGVKASWLWLAAFFVVLTAAELFILPVGLGLFSRLAPAHLAATTIAAWFLAAFAGNLLAGALGSLWSRIDHGAFFVLMAVVAGSSALLLRAFDAPVGRAERLREPSKNL